MTTRTEAGTLVRRRTRGPALYSYFTAPEGTPRAVVALLHGYADHGGRYAHVVDAWAERGIATIAIDMRGHGRAEGKRGFCEHFWEYQDDVAELIDLVRERAPAVPAFLVGHSFGGLVAATEALDRPSPWRALVLSAPYFALPYAVPPLRMLTGRFASRIAPAFGVPSGLKGADLTHDAARARAYDEDPLVFKNASVRWFTETQAAQEHALRSASGLTMPLYLVIGTQDHVVRVDSARAFFDAASSADKTWDPCEGYFHEVLNEPGWRAIADRVAQWVLAH